MRCRKEKGKEGLLPCLNTVVYNLTNLEWGGGREGGAAAAPPHLAHDQKRKGKAVEQIGKERRRLLLLQTYIFGMMMTA